MKKKKKKKKKASFKAALLYYSWNGMVWKGMSLERFKKTGGATNILLHGILDIQTIRVFSIVQLAISAHDVLFMWF